MEKRTATLNAKVAAVSLLLGAVVLHLTNQLDNALVPIRLLTLLILIMGAWSFSDEMGMRKPLNRAAFICFMFSMAALAVTVLNPTMPDMGKYVLIYAFMLLLAVLIWSAAFLHRQQSLKIIGTFGAIASLLPVAILIAGHISVGAAAFFGVDALLSAEGGARLLGGTAVNIIEAIFLLWAGTTAVFLMLGQMTPNEVIDGQIKLAR